MINNILTTLLIRDANHNVGPTFIEPNLMRGHSFLADLTTMNVPPPNSTLSFKIAESVTLVPTKFHCSFKIESHTPWSWTH